MIKDLTKEECLNILKNNYVGRLGYISKKSPYIIPITYFYYNHASNSIICYSGEGHKIEAMRKNHAVSLEVDEIKSVNSWRSILVHGKFEELHGIDAKHLLHEFTQGVVKIINQEGKVHPHFISEFSNRLHLEKVAVVYRIKILEVTGKKRESKNSPKIVKRK